MSDYSCYVTIVNNTGNPMTLVGAPGVVSGAYVTLPVPGLPTGLYFTFSMQESGDEGPEGSCVYTVTDGSGNSSNVTLSYTCPIMGSNAADAEWSGNILSDISIQMIPDPLPEFGSPVNVQFTFNQA